MPLRLVFTRACLNSQGPLQKVLSSDVDPELAVAMKEEEELEAAVFCAEVVSKQAGPGLTTAPQMQGGKQLTIACRIH